MNGGRPMQSLTDQIPAIVTLLEARPELSDVGLGGVLISAVTSS